MRQNPCTCLGLVPVLAGLALGGTILLKSAPARAAALVLYGGVGSPTSGTHGPNNDPTSLQGLAVRNIAGLPVPTAFSETPITGGVLVDTGANFAEYSGYGNYTPSFTSPFPVSLVNPAFPVLDQSLGYNIFFRVAVSSTSNTDPLRSVFSLTVTGNDLLGIELGFEPNAIFAQNTDFTARSETSGAIDTSIPTDYELQVFNGNYTLLANGSSILTGALKTYTFDPLTSNPPLPPTLNPYQIPNFLSFSDNTGQESGTFSFFSASIEAVPFEFQPASGLLLLAGLWGINRVRHSGKGRGGSRCTNQWDGDGLTSSK